jgi:hypothetical protein
MTSKLEEELLECVTTSGKIDMESMWFTYILPTVVHHETDGPILHVKKSVISDIDDMKACLKKRGFIAVQRKDEWHIFKPLS